MKSSTHHEVGQVKRGEVISEMESSRVENSVEYMHKFVKKKTGRGPGEV